MDTYFCIVTSLNRTHTMAILSRIENLLIGASNRKSVSNPSNSGWELVDLGDIVIHIMTGQQRQFYDLESLYSTAEVIPLTYRIENDFEHACKNKKTQNY